MEFGRFAMELSCNWRMKKVSKVGGKLHPWRCLELKVMGKPLISVVTWDQLFAIKTFKQSQLLCPVVNLDLHLLGMNSISFQKKRTWMTHPLIFVITASYCPLAGKHYTGGLHYGKGGIERLSGKLGWINWRKNGYFAITFSLYCPLLLNFA